MGLSSFLSFPPSPQPGFCRACLLSILSFASKCKWPEALTLKNPGCVELWVLTQMQITHNYTTRARRTILLTVQMRQTQQHLRPQSAFGVSSVHLKVYRAA